MKKTFYVFLTLSLLAISQPTLAAKPNFAPDLPQVNGVYDVSGHPGMKVRVFVHEPGKPNKPGKPGPSSELVCEGLTDPSGTETVKAAGWRIQPGTWTYRINPNVPSSISSDLSAIVDSSFAAWSSIPVLSLIGLVRGPDTSVNRAVYDGQNIIAWGRTSGSALGVTYIWYQNGIAIELDTIMNQKFTWDWVNQSVNNLCAYSNVYDAQNILTHELGHWFGLDDEYTSDYINHTMYGYGSKMEIKKDTLTQGDIEGINAIYY